MSSKFSSNLNCLDACFAWDCSLYLSPTCAGNAWNTIDCVELESTSDNFNDTGNLSKVMTESGVSSNASSPEIEFWRYDSNLKLVVPNEFFLHFTPV